MTTTYREPTSTNTPRWFFDHKGRLTTYKRYDEIEVYDATTPLWDLVDWVIGAETISSVTWSASGGLSVTGTGNGNTSAYATIAKTGSVVVKVTSSTGRVVEREFVWLSANDGDSDY